MYPIIDFYDAIDLVAAPSSKQPEIMSKLAAVQSDTVTVPARRMAGNPSEDAFAMSWRDNHGESHHRYRIDTV